MPTLPLRSGRGIARPLRRSTGRITRPCTATSAPGCSTAATPTTSRRRRSGGPTKRRGGTTPPTAFGPGGSAPAWYRTEGARGSARRTGVASRGWRPLAVAPVPDGPAGLLGPVLEQGPVAVAFRRLVGAYGEGGEADQAAAGQHPARHGRASSMPQGGSSRDGRLSRPGAVYTGSPRGAVWTGPVREAGRFGARPGASSCRPGASSRGVGTAAGCTFGHGVRAGLRAGSRFGGRRRGKFPQPPCGAAPMLTKACFDGPMGCDDPARATSRRGRAGDPASSWACVIPSCPEYWNCVKLRRNMVCVFTFDFLLMNG
jgi:hypothetical protein